MATVPQSVASTSSITPAWTFLVILKALAVSEIAPLFLEIDHYLKGQPFVVVSKAIVDVTEYTHSIPQ